MKITFIVKALYVKNNITLYRNANYTYLYVVTENNGTKSHTFWHIIVQTPMRAFFMNILLLVSPVIDFVK